MRTEVLENLTKLALLPKVSLPSSARQMALFSLFDWLVVGWAGRNEPVACILRSYFASEGGREVASVFGGGKVPARAAALVNGTISHALDYDDTHFAHIGHLSVGILPAALAVAEETGASAANVADAFLVGAEASVRLGMVFGRKHYLRGFHQTATAGAFGATIAAGRLYGLDEAQMRNALSLVATRASGLKSQFGTMGKPYNAGLSAANGVECAGLAKLGFMSCDDGIAGSQGFIDTHSDEPDFAVWWQNPPPETFLFEDIKYKLHACCHGTHAMIEAFTALLASNKISPDRVKRINLRVNPRWLGVCDIKKPRTGLEVKFSYVWLAGMVFHGIDTSADASYIDGLCANLGLVDFANKITIEGDSTVSDTATHGVLETTDGQNLFPTFDISARLNSTVVETGLRKKARGLIGENIADRYWSTVSNLDRIGADALASMIRE